MRYIFLTFSLIFFSIKNFFFHIKTFFSADILYFVKKHKHFFKKEFFFQLSFATNEQAFKIHYPFKWIQLNGNEKLG